MWSFQRVRLSPTPHRSLDSASAHSWRVLTLDGGIAQRARRMIVWIMEVFSVEWCGLAFDDPSRRLGLLRGSFEDTAHGLGSGCQPSDVLFAKVHIFVPHSLRRTCLL